MENRSHELKLKERSSFLATGVIHVDNYDEKVVSMKTTYGMLKIIGEDLTIKNLNLNDGILEVNGQINELVYFQEQGKKAKGIMQRIFK